MRVKLCKICGYQLSRQSTKCPWCKTLVKKNSALLYSISALIIFTTFFLLKPIFLKKDIVQKSSHSEPNLTRAVKSEKVKSPVKTLGKIPAKVYVKETTVNIRQHPSNKSRVISKLKKGQLLTKITPDPSSKGISQHQAFKVFRKYFKQFNAKIKKLKGTAFFEHVEYLDRGVIQVTATYIFLSAPEVYKKKYIGKITQKWMELRKPGLPGIVRIVDREGILRMKMKRY